MSLVSSRVAREAKGTIDAYINIRVSDEVPETTQIALEKNEAVQVEAAYLYADMVDSSSLAQTAYKPVSAKIIRSYVNGASQILRHYGGSIASFDGDRVMAIFVGTNKETTAVRAALAINWLVAEELGPKIREKWDDIAKYWTLRHSIGIDVGEALITRGGVRGDNDLISIGKAPNVAAKLSDIRNDKQIHITHEVFGPMSQGLATTETGVRLWTAEPGVRVGGRNIPVLGSGAYWEP